MSRRIKFRTQCFCCGEWFEAGQAFLQRVKGKWFCQCDACFEKRKTEKRVGA